MKALVLVSVLACGGDKGSSEAAQETPSRTIHALSSAAPAGCARKNQGTSIGEWIQFDCKTGDVTTEVDVTYSEDPSFPNADAYVASRKLEKWKDLVVTTKEEKLADGWLAVFSLSDSKTLFVLSERTIGGRHVVCGAAEAPLAGVEQAIAACKSIR